RADQSYGAERVGKLPPVVALVLQGAREQPRVEQVAPHTGPQHRRRRAEREDPLRCGELLDADDPVDHAALRSVLDSDQAVDAIGGGKEGDSQPEAEEPQALRGLARWCLFSAHVAAVTR